MKIDQREKLIRRYLLGELAEMDQTVLEQELLSDRDKFDQVWVVENELVDSYARGERSSADRERFESHYLVSPLHRERVAIAKAFLANIDQAPGEKKAALVPWRGRFLPDSPRPVFGMALVMALLLTFSAAWSYIERVRLTRWIANIQANVQKEAQTERAFLKQRELELTSRNQEVEKKIADVRQRNERLKAEIEQLRRGRQAATPTVLSFLLTPTPVRGEKALPLTTIPLITGKARLLMELNGADYANYQIILQTVEKREILRRRASKVMISKDRAFAMLPVKAGELSKGDYVLILFGQTADTRSEEIDRYIFRVS